MCGYGSHIILGTCTDEDISDVEKYMRDDWAEIMKRRSNEPDHNAQMLNYFGELFRERPSQFKFMLGHKKLINALVSHINRVAKSSEDSGLKHFSMNLCVNSFRKIDSNNFESQKTIVKSYLLNRLVSTAERNQSRKKNGRRYDSDIKAIATYVRLLTGPFAYETIQRNMDCSLPSLSSTNQYIRSSNCQIVEGVLRSLELQKYLNDRKFPPVVCLSVDETRIEDEIQYDAKTNQITGFTLPLNKLTGLPKPLHYPARNATEIIRHFSIQNPISSNLYVVMAQPLAHNAAAFCLLAYGTDKKYNATDVAHQWESIIKELDSVGISVLSLSSDSEPKYNSAMRYHSKLGVRSDILRFDWFSSASNENGPFFIQDIEHIGTKLRNYMLKTSWNPRRIPFGRNNFIQINHLYFVMNKFRKDRHELTKSVLNPTDKQNFRSVEKMCSEKVISLLKIFPQCYATVCFLQLIRDVIEAFRNQKLEPLERVRKMWYNIFILRLWKRYVSQNAHYTQEKIFITSYTYICIELNGHSLVQIIIYLHKINRPEWFLPHYFGSQQCENIFRQLRSLSSTYSTVTNCSTKEALTRLSKIEIQNNIINSNPDFKFPRYQTKNKKSAKTFSLPSLEEIIRVIEQCEVDAIELAKKMNLITENDLTDTELLSCSVNPYILPKNVEKEPMLNINIKPFKHSDFCGLTLKDFSANKNDIDENGPYVELRVDNNSKRMVIRKSTFAWLLRADKHRLSSDRLRRVQCSTKTDNATNTKKRRRTKKMNAKKSVFMYPNKKLNSKKI